MGGTHRKTVVSIALAGLLLSGTAAFAADAPSRTSTPGPTVMTPNKVVTPATHNVVNKATKTSPTKDHTVGMETIGEAKDKPQGPNNPPSPPPPDPPNATVMQSQGMT
jgi:hypothetical protein